MKDRSKLYLNTISNGTAPAVKAEEPKPEKKAKAKKKEK